MKILEPNLVILDETDSGLDIDALKIVADGVNSSRDDKKSFLVITHYQRLLNFIKPDFVHVLADGKIVKSGNKELAIQLEKLATKELIKMLNFKIDSNELDKIGKFTKEEKEYRIKNLDYFNDTGFPNKKDEDWKFSDLKNIVSKNFNKLELKIEKSEKPKINFIKDFEHNYIVIVNGELTLSNFKYEDESKIKLRSFINKDYSEKKENNPLVNLNNALSDNGYYLEVEENYKFKKSIGVLLFVYQGFK